IACSFKTASPMRTTSVAIASGCHHLQCLPFQDVHATKCGKLDDALMSQFGEYAGDSFDRQAKVVGNVQSGHWQFNLSQYALPFGHVRYESGDTFNGVLPAKYEEVLVRPHHGLKRQWQQSGSSLAFI